MTRPALAVQEDRRPSLREWTWLAANVVAIPILAWLWWKVASRPHQSDVFAFWNAWSDGQLYPPSWQPVSEYVYSPAFAQAFWPLTLFRFSLVNAGWAALQVLALAWMLRPAGAAIALLWPLPFIGNYGGLPFAGPVYATLFNGNPMILTAAAITFGLVRWPGAFSFVLLTKVSAGIGILYFAIRRQWRAFATAVGVTAGIALVSFVIAPGLWFEWVNLLAGAATHAGSAEALAKERYFPVPLMVRGPLGLVVVAISGWRGWAWAVPIGCFLALPDIHLGGYAVLAAVPAVWLRERAARAREKAVSASEHGATGAP